MTVLTECRWCGQSHGPLCPSVKAMEFDGTGAVITRVEFLTPADMVQRRREDEPPPYEKLKAGE